MVNQKTPCGKSCPVCQQDLLMRITFKFKNTPFFSYAIFSNVEEGTKESSLRLTQVIKGVKYVVFAYTITLYPETSFAHFVTKFVQFYYDGRKSAKFVYDGMLSKPEIQQKLSNELVNTVWLIRAT